MSDTEDIWRSIDALGKNVTQLNKDVLSACEIIAKMSLRIDALEHRLEAAGTAAQSARDELVQTLIHATKSNENVRARDLAPAIEKIAVAVVMASKP
jgi:hypothetical protein